MNHYQDTLNRKNELLHFLSTEKNPDRAAFIRGRLVEINAELAAIRARLGPVEPDDRSASGGGSASVTGGSYEHRMMTPRP